MLPYAFERSDGADGFPSLSTTGAQATRCLVAKLVRADPSDAADARAALEVLAGATRKDGVFQAAAALYGVAATKLAAMNQPWVLVEEDEELQLELPTNCVWDDNEQLCELARAKRLAPFYAGLAGRRAGARRRGRRAQAREMPRFPRDPRRAPRVGRRGVRRCFTLARVLPAPRGGLRRVDRGPGGACANSFVAQRLILVPKPGGAVLVALRADEAYWDVSAHLRHTALDHYALSHHFDASLRTFFVDVLGVNPELLEEPAVSSNGHTMPGTGEPSTIQDGLRSADLAAPPSTGAAGAAPTEALARAALARVADGDSSQLPPAFRSLPASLDAFAAACRSLGVNPRAVAIAEPDRCAFLLDGCVILSAGRMRRIRRDDTPFLVTELRTVSRTPPRRTTAPRTTRASKRSTPTRFRVWPEGHRRHRPRRFRTTVRSVARSRPRRGRQRRPAPPPPERGRPAAGSGSRAAAVPLLRPRAMPQRSRMPFFARPLV